MNTHHRPLRCIALAWAATTLATPAWSGDTLERIRQSGHVVVAYRVASVPFSYVDEAGQPIGYAIDLCRHLVAAIAHEIGVPRLATDYLSVTSATRIAAVAEGRADLECESTTDTAERRRRVAFTVPHYITGARYVVRADSPIAQLGDFSGRRLVSTTGTTPLAAIREADRQYRLGVRIGEVADHLSGIEAVENGSADGFAMDEVLLAGLIATRPDPGRLKIVGKYLTIEPLAIMLPRGDPAFKKLLDDEMKRLIRSGEAADLHTRWFERPIPPSQRTLALRMPSLLRDFWRYPTDWVPR